MNEQDSAFERKAKAAFDRSVDELDAATLSRLNRGTVRARSSLAESTPREFFGSGPRICVSQASVARGELFFGFLYRGDTKSIALTCTESMLCCLIKGDPKPSVVLS